MNITNADWAASALWPTFQSPNHLDVYEIRSASPDIQLAITTMTGNINRQQPQAYLLSSNDAAFWLQQVVQQLGNQYQIVKPSRLLELLP